MIIHGSVIRTKFQLCKLQLKHEINMTNLRVQDVHNIFLSNYLWQQSDI
jgi:hypothetical protein